MQEGGCAMAKQADPKPATVPFGATPAGQPPSVKEWANRYVWTERMLDALQKGVRGGKWHTLHDKVYNRTNLTMASQMVLGNQGSAGVDQQTVLPSCFGANRQVVGGRLHVCRRCGFEGLLRHD